MRNLDFTPLYRSTVGFDRLASLLDSALAAETSSPSYPPYNIEKTGENAYRITVAVAGFTENELSIETRQGQLIISGAKEKRDSAPTYLHRGIAERGFERRFQLADHVKASGASLENGLLHVDLTREVPEALKPRNIAITRGAPANGAAKTIEATVQEAETAE